MRLPPTPQLSSLDNFKILHNCTRTYDKTGKCIVNGFTVLSGGSSSCDDLLEEKLPYNPVCPSVPLIGFLQWEVKQTKAFCY